MSPQSGARRRRLGSIRLSLILLALVPGITLTAMWGVTTTQMFTEGLRLRTQTELSRSTGAMGTEATLTLQRERSLSAVWLASGPGASRTALEAQRERTDEAVAKLVTRADDIQKAPARVRDRLYSVVASVSSLEYYRGQVDDPVDITAAQALDQYTSIIDDQIHAFQELSQVDDGDLTSQAGPLVALEHAAELVSEEDLQLTLAGPRGRMDEKTWAEFTQLVNSRRWLVQDQIVPSLTGDAKEETEQILTSYQWQTLEAIENKVLAARAKQGESGDIVLPDVQKVWRAALIDVSDQYAKLIRRQTTTLLQHSADNSRGLLIKAASLSAGGLLALLVCIGMSWRITRSLSRRLHGLRMATLGLAHERLPDVVARLDRGETVDVDAETPPLDYGNDELGQVAAAFNTAQRTAVHTAVELADTRRGFQKVILGIARQSQNLVNLQLSKLDALERRHQDPDVLKGLYELDSTASQLRRYEENLVIISGGRPGRSWTDPVALIDILRSAVGEVAEYRRVEVHTEEDVYIAPPAVADVIHLLAELIDNATSYSPAPSPVGVRATMVAKGLAIEVEDRGLGMPEDDYASFNEQLAVPPKFDVVALADDLRLGMFVIARLATRHGIAVTLRSSPYGGTTAIVLVPHDIVVLDAPGDRSPADEQPGSPATAGSPRAQTDLTTRGREPADQPGDAGADGTAQKPGVDARKDAGATRAAPAGEGPGGTGADGVPEREREQEEAQGKDLSTAAAPGTDTSGASPSRTDASRGSSSADSTSRGSASERTSSQASDPSVADQPDATEARDPGNRGDGTDTSDDTSSPDSTAGAEEAGVPVRAVGRVSGRSAVPVAERAVRPGGLRPLPRRIPQTSLASELRDDVASAAGTGNAEESGFPDDFTAERAASSLAGFQRGTRQALVDADADEPHSGPRETAVAQDAGPPVTATGTFQTSTPPADRS
ncbi:histidine kinase [Streptomyces humidus]|uniref:histidine kinase n=1 Tax=Streptomyces humidus TaxID=52259 RepID=A0A918FQX6_9ACTN|nr:nitrate- and nitrite sensing domain-containing protein [Streptomyces humidus]GGR69839.1 histidine kinase [Streptomyces humidus]